MLELAPSRPVVWGPGQYHLAVVAVEFPDARETLAASWGPRVIHEADAYFREVSGGAVRWIAAPVPAAKVRMRRPSSWWRLRRRSLADRVRFWRRVMGRVLLPPADAVLAVVPRYAFMRGCFAVGPRWNSPRMDEALQRLDGIVPRGAVVKSSTPWTTIVHELGHVLGLPDLYDYEYDRERLRWSVRASRYVGSWDLMGRISPRRTDMRPHPMAWTKALAGWITPVEWTPQRECYTVGPSADAVRIEIGRGRALFVEGRVRKGFDADLPSEGVLVSIADEGLPEGRGPLQLVVPSGAVTTATSRRRPVLTRAALRPGQTCSYAGIEVRVIDRTPHGFDVRITRI